ncbi:alpha/beta hydrolase [Sphingomonas sp.]|uniref:alpha/beta hydrolase n=1 Tax=Sphingomonas sp. TaxID=28214 RepID=UPI003AFFECB5
MSNRAFLTPLLLLLAAASLPETRLAVTLPAGWNGDASGRLLLFAEPATAENAKADAVDTAEFGGKDAVSVAARDVASFGAARSATIDTQETAFPAGFASLKPGDYRVQAVLDRNGDYDYGGRGEGDLVSRVVTIRWPQRAASAIALDHAVQAIDPWHASTPEGAARAAAMRPHLHEERLPSVALTRFWGTPHAVTAWVLTPPGYDPRGRATYPTVYTAGGFGTTHARDIGRASRLYDLEAKREIPPMIWVFLDHSEPTGTTEFADSVNNGPWGQALTTEAIPALEARFRMDARPSGRFLTGHSSGGWFALWVMVRYPALFGGSWPTAPDPADFRDFTGIDLTAPNANAYRDPSGRPWPLVRDHGRVVASFEQFARLETVLGHDGGQIRSFDWVFSPRAKDGTPAYMFDRVTGAVDPTVISYWRDHYDVAHRIEAQWPALRHDLDGKLHLTVGTADTFYLDGAARRLEAAFRGVGGRADFTYLPDKTHGDLYERGGDPQALTKDIAWAMYAVARPASKRLVRSRPAPAP